MSSSSDVLDASPKKLLVNVPRLSKTLIAVCSLLSLLLIILPDYFVIFALRPGYTFSWNFFNILTSGFLDSSIFNIIFSVYVILVFGKYLEPIWGSKEYFKFIVVVNAMCGVATFLAIIFFYMTTLNEKFLYTYYWCGLSGITMALTVAIKQLLPELQLSFFLPLPIRAKYYPSIMIAISTLLFLFGISVKSYPYTIFGFYISWLYLRFFQRRGSGNDVAVGDMNENFAFKTFFPEIIQGPIDSLGSIMFNVLSACGACKNVNKSSNSSDNSDIEEGNFGTVSAEAERRRARAAKALEERLAKMEKKSSTSASSSSTDSSNNTSSSSTNSNKDSTVVDV